MVLGIQVAGTLFGLFLLYYTFLKYKRRELQKKEYLFWMVVWALFIVVALFPNILDPVVKTLNFARTFDLLLTTGFLFIMGLVFHTYLIVRKNQRQVEIIVRSIAMEKRKEK